MKSPDSSGERRLDPEKYFSSIHDRDCGFYRSGRCMNPSGPCTENGGECRHGIECKDRELVI